MLLSEALCKCSTELDVIDISLCPGSARLQIIALVHWVSNRCLCCSWFESVIDPALSHTNWASCVYCFVCMVEVVR